MPLSTNEQTNKTAHGLVDTMQQIFGTPPDARAAHAKGQLTKGVFTPSKEAAALSTAQIFQQASTPIIVRFSSSTGIPNIPDSNPQANPRGIAIRFTLSEDGHKHYDIIGHSKNGFPVRTGEEFLEFLTALKSGDPSNFISRHPEVQRFGALPVGFPESFATEQFFGVNAFKFTNAAAKPVFFRYRIAPEESVKHITQEEAEAAGANYLYNELTSRLNGQQTLKFTLLAQIAEAGDPTDDATQQWPESRQIVSLGTIAIQKLWNSDEGNGVEQKRLIYDPVPRDIQGIEASDDPLIDVRAAVYLIDGKKRRAAAGVA